MEVNLQARTLPALAGWSWITGGFALFRRNPPLMTATSLSYVLCALLLSLIPLLGPLVAAFVLPAFQVVVFNSARLIDQGGEITRERLAEKIEPNYRTLMKLGLLQLAISQVVTLIVRATVDLPEAPDQIVDASQVLGLSLAVLPMLLTWLLLMWFPPFLIARFDLTLGRSIFFGVVAIFRNPAAFLVFIASAGLLSFGLSLVVTMVAGIIGLGAGGVSTLLFMALIFVFVPTQAASTYVSFQQVFAVEQPPAPEHA